MDHLMDRLMNHLIMNLRPYVPFMTDRELNIILRERLLCFPVCCCMESDQFIVCYTLEHKYTSEASTNAV